MQVVAVVFVIVGFGFKVSAVPFHTWAPDTYEGAPTPVTAFLSVASKAAGFVALADACCSSRLYPADDVYEPFLWVLAALTMTVGNVLALRQTNIVRMLAYSSVSQGGFILMPLAVMATGDAAESALKSVVIYLLIYAFSNLGAFAVVIAVSRKTHSGEISSFGGLMSYAPGMGRADDDLPRLARRRSAARHLDRQAAVVQDAARRRRHGGLDAGRDRRRQHRDRRRLLRAGDARDVDEAGARRRHDADRHAAAGVAGARASAPPARSCSASLPGLVLRFADLPDLTSRLRRLSNGVRRHSTPVPFDRFMAEALYGPNGFYTQRRTRRPARRLHHVARGRPAVRRGRRPLPRRRVGTARPARPFTVVDAGAGPGTLARSVLAAAPGLLPRPCGTSRSRCRPIQRERSIRPASSRAPTCPTGPFDGVIIANELLDNLPFRLAVHDGGGARRTSSRSPDGRLVEVAERSVRSRYPACCPRTPRSARGHRSRTRPATWIDDARRRLRGGTLLVDRLHVADDRRARRRGRGGSGCARTAAHERGDHYLADPARRTSPSRWRSTSCPSPTRSAPSRSGCSCTGSTSWSTRAAATGSAGRPPRPRGDADAQPGRRGRGAARSGRPRRLHGARVPRCAERTA